MKYKVLTITALAGSSMESHAGWKGLCRKAMTLLYVLIAARLDALVCHLPVLAGSKIYRNHKIQLNEGP